MQYGLWSCRFPNLVVGSGCRTRSFFTRRGFSITKSPPCRCRGDCVSSSFLTFLRAGWWFGRCLFGGQGVRRSEILAFYQAFAVSILSSRWERVFEKQT